MCRSWMCELLNPTLNIPKIKGKKSSASSLSQAEKFPSFPVRLPIDQTERGQQEERGIKKG